MKKIVAFVLAMVLTFSFSACKKEENDGNDAILNQKKMVAEKPEPEVETQEQEVNLIGTTTIEHEIKNCLSLYSSVLKEDFGVSIDEKDFSIRLYSEEDTEYQTVAGMVSDEALKESGVEADGKGVIRYAGYVVDPAYAACHLVLDYYSCESIQNEFSPYMDEKLYMDSFEENLMEYGGFVYLVRGGRDYGSVSFENPVTVEETAEKVVVRADKYLRGENDGTIEFTFSLDAHREPVVKLEKVA